MDMFFDTEEKIFFWVFTLLIIIEIIIAAVLFLRTKNFIDNARHIKAKITGFEDDKSIKIAGKHPQKPIVSFQDPMTGPINISIKPVAHECKIGDEVIMYVNKENPRDVKAKSPILWIMPFVFLQSAVMMIGILIYLIYDGQVQLPF